MQSRTAEIKSLPRVIYVMGEGRSGSTLLDQMLGTHENVWGAGELWSFFSEETAITGDCSCGQKVSDCTYWQEVKTQYLGAVGDSDLKRSHELRTALDGVKALVRSLLRVPPGRFSVYQKDTHAIYRVLSEVTGRTVVVDSTKQVGRAHNLLRMEDLDVRVIHLVRDGRGVTWSRLRDRKRDPSVWRHGPYQSIFNWVVKNLLGVLIGRLHPDRYLRVKYEELVTDPASQMARIGDFSGLDYSDATEKLLAGGVEAGHEIGGNKKARTGTEPRALKLDEEWKRELPTRYNLFYILFAGITSKLLGY